MHLIPEIGNLFVLANKLLQRAQGKKKSRHLINHKPLLSIKIILSAHHYLQIAFFLHILILPVTSNLITLGSRTYGQVTSI